MQHLLLGARTSSSATRRIRADLVASLIADEDVRAPSNKLHIEHLLSICTNLTGDDRW